MKREVIEVAGNCTAGWTGAHKVTGTQHHKWLRGDSDLSRVDAPAQLSVVSAADYKLQGK